MVFGVLDCVLILLGILLDMLVLFGILVGLFGFVLVGDGPTCISIIVSLLSLLYKYSKFLGVSKGV